LSNIINYADSHDIWVEIIRRQKIETFTEEEWGIIGQVWMHRFCWNAIYKRFGEKIMPIFEKMAKVGYGEWEEKYKQILEANNV